MEAEQKSTAGIQVSDGVGSGTELPGPRQRRRRQAIPFWRGHGSWGGGGSVLIAFLSRQAPFSPPSAVRLVITMSFTKRCHLQAVHCLATAKKIEQIRRPITPERSRVLGRELLPDDEAWCPKQKTDIKLWPVAMYAIECKSKVSITRDCLKWQKLPQHKSQSCCLHFVVLVLP